MDFEFNSKIKLSDISPNPMAPIKTVNKTKLGDLFDKKISELLNINIVFSIGNVVNNSVIVIQMYEIGITGDYMGNLLNSYGGNNRNTD